jgi:hypothetical protein
VNEADRSRTQDALDRQRPVVRYRSTIIVLYAASIVLSGIVAGRALGLFDGSCGGGRPGGWGVPATPDNVMITFLGDVQDARDPMIMGGPSDPWQCAYDVLCDRQRDRVSAQQLRDSRGEALSPLLSADTHAGPSAYVDRGLRSQHTYPWDDVESTWIEVEAAWYERIDARTVVTDSRREEHWRVDLVRESGDWRVCGFAPVRS